MLRLSTVILFFILSSTSQFALAGNNYGLHFGLSNTFGYASESFLHYNTELSTTKRIAISTAVASLPGLMKEIQDSGEENNQFSQGDLAADIAGAFLGSIIANTVNTKLQIKLSKSKDTTKISASYSF